MPTKIGQLKGHRIALLLDSSPRTWTSQEDIHLHLCKAVKAAGAEIVLVFAKPVSASICDRFLEAGAHIEVAPYFKVTSYYRDLKTIFAKYKITLVHICFFDYFSLVPWLARLNGAKNIIFEQLNSGTLRAQSWRQQLVRLRGAAATWPARRVIAISQFVKDELVKCGVDHRKITVRYLGVDTERFHPEASARDLLVNKYNIQSSDLIVSTVSVLRGFKHPETIIEACGILRQRGVAFRLLVGGDGELVPRLKARSEDLGIADSINWLGYCNDPKALLQGSDVFVLTSIGEAFGLVLTEAMACGVPVVGTRSGAIPEIVTDGETGLLADPHDPKSVADQIEILAEDRRLLAKMRNSSVERVRTRYSVSLDVDRTLEIYSSLL